MDKNENSENGEKEGNAVKEVTETLAGKIVRMEVKESWRHGGE